MTKKILVIEDDNILQKAMKAALEEAGFEVSQALDGQKGLKAMRTKNPDLVLLDLIMPKKDGWVVLQEINADAKISHIPVFVFTAYEKEETITKCKNLGAKGFFFKSAYTLEEIVQKVKENT